MLLWVTQRQGTASRDLKLEEEVKLKVKKDCKNFENKGK